MISISRIEHCSFCEIWTEWMPPSSPYYHFQSKKQINQSESSFIISFFSRYPFSIKLVNSVISILFLGNAMFKKVLSSFNDKKNIPSISRLLFISNILLI